MGDGKARTRRVRGDVLSGRDAVTDVARLDGVRARTVGGGNGCACRMSVWRAWQDLHGGGHAHCEKKGSATSAATTELANMASDYLERLRRW